MQTKTLSLTGILLLWEPSPVHSLLLCYWYRTIRAPVLTHDLIS